MGQSARHEIRFLLNGETIVLDRVSPTETLLDYLRLSARLRGTKEGCGEGDCGACTVLVGRVVDGGLVYESVNACIRFVGSLDGCHVVTIEYLRGADGDLHPVQKAMVEFHGSQCGFCTPGFVMSLYALWMRDPRPADAAIEKALQGNLCRCTGYEAIMRAARHFRLWQCGAGSACCRACPCSATPYGPARRCAGGGGGGQDRLIVPADLDDFAPFWRQSRKPPSLPVQPMWACGSQR